MNNTALKDRTLWYDGDSTLPHEKLLQYIQLGNDTSGLFVDEITTDIKQFNALVPHDQQIKIKEEVNILDTTWNIPQEYLDLNLSSYLNDKLVEEAESHSDYVAQYWKARLIRVADELNLYRKLNLENVLRTIIYIINTLDSKKVVWGVGRGSSVSSYLLYLIGVHNVDSIEYDLDITDFLRI